MAEKTYAVDVDDVLDSMIYDDEDSDTFKPMDFIDGAIWAFYEAGMLSAERRDWWHKEAFRRLLEVE